MGGGGGGLPSHGRRSLRGRVGALPWESTDVACVEAFFRHWASSLLDSVRRKSQQQDRLVEVVAEEVVASGAAPEEDSRDAAIDRLYAELRQLLSRPESSAASEIEQKRALLRGLQQKEAAAMRERYIARSPLKPGVGWQALSEARKLLSEKTCGQ